MTEVKPTLISGNYDVGVCCICDTYDSQGILVNHVHHVTLYYCQHCNHLCCKEHLEPCGFCTGCCAEEHGLGHCHKE